jgi:hypothetical protein
MILTDDFVFIHEPKTGGTFVTKMLNRLYEPVRQTGVKRLLRRVLHIRKKQSIEINKHGTCSDIPKSHRGKPILATIRNPYDRYISQFEFAWWKERPQDYCDVEQLRKQFPHYPNLTFGEFIDLNNTLFMKLKNELFPPEESMGRQTEQFVRYFFKNPDRVFPAIDAGYIASGKYRADMFPVHFIHTDRLNQELHDYLLELGFVREELHFILTSGKILPGGAVRSEDRPWQKYYTPELKRKVRTKERLLFSLFPEFDV